MITMCRVVGIVDFEKSLREDLKHKVISMRDSLAHGGPHGAGVYINEDKYVALGHRRLSIIDASPNGHQPMSNRDKTIWVVCNGEIYNFLELREQLIQKGYQFYSRTDTEVLVHGYEEWGIEGLLFRLQGMFAFAIYDFRKGPSSLCLILARDRFGIKPLYYYQDNQKLVFASEVKAITKSGLVPNETNIEAVARFLQLGSVPVPLTTVKNVFSLPGGHYMILDDKGSCIKQYWNISDHMNHSNVTSFDEAIISTRQLLMESVRLHVTNDMPLGVFLSGGIDSSGLVALSNKFRDDPLTTLSIVFEEEEYNETQYARLVAKQYKTNHHEILIKGKDFFDELPYIFSAMDQPTIDGINTYFVSKAAKEIGLNVVLSGIGGDELFLGYGHFRKAKYLQSAMKFFRLLPKWIRRSSINNIAYYGSKVVRKNLEKLTYLEDPRAENAYLLFRGLLMPQTIQNLLGISEKEFKSFGPICNLFNGSMSMPLLESLNCFDFKHYLQNQILKDTDFMSMAHSVEVRVPYLEHRLVEHVVSFPQNIKLHGDINKPLLVRVLENELPKEILTRSKRCFDFPVEEWIRKNSNDLQAVNLEHGILNRKAKENIWKGFKDGHIHWSRIWAILVLEKFLLNERESFVL